MWTCSSPLRLPSVVHPERRDPGLQLSRAKDRRTTVLDQLGQNAGKSHLAEGRGTDLLRVSCASTRISRSQDIRPHVVATRFRLEMVAKP